MKRLISFVAILRMAILCVMVSFVFGVRQAEATVKYTLTDLGASFPGSVSRAYDINASGQVVGGAENAAGEFHAFLYDSGTMTDLNDLLPSGSGWELLSARGINDNGQFAGQGRIDGEWHAFLMTPVPNTNPIPEPSSILIWSILAITFATISYRRRR